MRSELIDLISPSEKVGKGCPDSQCAGSRCVVGYRPGIAGIVAVTLDYPFSAGR